MYDLFHSRVGQYLLLGVNFGCDGASDVIYFTSNHLGISPSVLLPIDRLKSHYDIRIRLQWVIDADTKVNENDI